MATAPLKVGGKVFGRFLGNTVSAAAGFSAGAAIGPVLGPAVQALKNTVNSQYAYVFPDPVSLAAGVAQGQVAEKTARLYASYHGFGDDAMTALINIANTGPQLGMAFDAWRRGLLTPEQFKTALRRTGLEPQWDTAIMGLKPAVLAPAEIAAAIHKDIIKDPGALATPQPQGDGKVPHYDLVPIDALAEMEAWGFDLPHLTALVGLQGNPMGGHEAAQALFRGIIDPVDYERAIAQSNTRNEWGPSIMEQSRQIITAHDAVENTIRGYHDQAWLAQQTGRHGMSQADTDILFENAGRPLTVHQITTGLARGGKFHPEPNELTDPYEASVHESNIKPSYYELAIANKYTLPGYFVVKAMLSDGTLTEPEAATIFEQSGWPPDLSAKAAAALAGGGSKTKTLTPAQIRAGVKAGAIQQADALSRLEAQGYSAADAQLYLNLPASAASS